MRHAVAACCVAVCLACPAVGAAQSPTDVATAPQRTDTGFWSPFQSVPKDVVRFFSDDTLKVLAVGGFGAFAAHEWDGKGIEQAQEHLRPSLFRAGNIGGGALVQTGAAFGLYSVARVAGANRLALAGADLVRAQALSQAIVQAGKFTTRRTRPDGSNNHSLPSGHTATAFATATVLQQHFGWKAGIPAYGFGAYVAASRMSVNKHHLSDVLLGAAIGVAAGRTVTVGTRDAKFDLGVEPTRGGAAVTFTKR